MEAGPTGAVHVGLDEDADAADSVELHLLVLVEVAVAEGRHVLAVGLEHLFVAWGGEMVSNKGDGTDLRL